MNVQPVVRQDPDDSRRETGHDDLDPEADRLFVDRDLSCLRIPAEGPDRVPVQDHDSHDGSELDNDQEHLHKHGGYPEGYQLIQQDHVTGAADGKPFRDAFHDTEQQRF